MTPDGRSEIQQWVWSCTYPERVSGELTLSSGGRKSDQGATRDHVWTALESWRHCMSSQGLLVEKQEQGKYTERKKWAAKWRPGVALERSHGRSWFWGVSPSLLFPAPVSLVEILDIGSESLEASGESGDEVGLKADACPPRLVIPGSRTWASGWGSKGFRPVKVLL